MVSRERTYRLKSVLRNFSFKRMLDQSTHIDNSLTHTFMAFLCYSLPEKHISFIHITHTSFIHITHTSFIHISTHTLSGNCLLVRKMLDPPLPTYTHTHTHTHTHIDAHHTHTHCQEIDCLSGKCKPPPPHTHIYTYTRTPYTYTLSGN